LDLTPLIDSEPYVEVLEQMAQTVQRYQSEPMTPGQIFNAIRRGRLQGGLGYEAPAEQTDPAEGGGEAAGEQAGTEVFDVLVFDCPLETRTDRLWFPQSTPLACLSSGSRQTDASKRLIGWLSGGSELAPLRQRTARFSRTRRPPKGEGFQTASAYARWLEQRLGTLQVLPSLVLPGGNEYYNVLNRHVRRYLQGEGSAHEALSQAAAQWQTLTDRLGRQRQVGAWKRNLGFGG
jgi:hypothetical protein